MNKYKCTKCKEELDLINFRKRNNVPRGHQYWCIKCEGESNKIRYRLSHPKKIKKELSDSEILEKNELIKEKNRRRMLKWRYNITLEEYNDMYLIQNGCCAICNNEFLLTPNEIVIAEK
jgi:hypothetical protein